MCSKIFERMVSILQQVQMEREKIVRPMGVPQTEIENMDNQEGKIKLNFSDIYAQRELKKIMMKVNATLKPKKIYKLQMIFASLISNSLMSPSFFQSKFERVLYKLNAKVDPKYENKKEVETYISNCNVDNEEANVIPN